MNTEPAPRIIKTFRLTVSRCLAVHGPLYLQRDPGYWPDVLHLQGSTCFQAYETKIAAENDAFAAFKKKFDAERMTTTRTNYEVDFINNFNKLATLGAIFDKDAYLHTVQGFRLQ